MDGKERKRGREREKEREVGFTTAFLTWVNTEEKQTLTRARTMAPKTLTALLQISLLSHAFTKVPLKGLF